MGVFAAHLKELADIVGAVSAEGTATGGTTTTIVDSMRVEADDAWNDQRVYIYEGTGLGEERVISDFVNSTNTITFSPSGSTIDTTSKYIILEQGWTMEMLRKAIIMAIRRRRKDMLLPKVDDTVTLDASTPTYEYAVPSGFVAINQILRETTSGSGIFEEEVPQEMWYIMKTSTRKIVFNQTLVKQNGLLADNTDIRIIGQQYETEPTADSSTLSIPMGNLLLLAASIAHLMRAPSDLNNSEKRVALAQGLRAEFEADKWQDYQPIYPGSVKVEDV